MLFIPSFHVLSSFFYHLPGLMAVLAAWILKVLMMTTDIRTWALPGWPYQVNSEDVNGYYPLAEVTYGKREKDKKKRDLCRPPTVLSCSHWLHLWSKLAGFQNRFHLMWNVRALLRLHAGNFWAHSCYRAESFSKLRRTWLKRYWLLWKRQCTRDRKRIWGRQKSLSFC